MSNAYYLKTKFKNSLIAYLCLFVFLGHYAYLGKWKVQLLVWSLFLAPAIIGITAVSVFGEDLRGLSDNSIISGDLTLGIMLIVSVASWIILAIWVIVDLFRIPGKVDTYNFELSERIQELEMT